MNHETALRESFYLLLAHAIVPGNSAKETELESGAVAKHLRSGNGLAIFGAGGSGRNLLKLFRALGVPCSLLIDNNQALHETDVEGILVRSPAQLGTAGLRAQPIFIASMYSAQIAQSLSSCYGLKPRLDFFQMDIFLLNCLVTFQAQVEFSVLRNSWNGKNLAIFDAGQAGRNLLHQLRTLRISCTSFIDNDKVLDGTQIDGIVVRSPESLGREELRAQPIIIASMFRSEIALQLTKIYDLTPRVNFFELDVFLASGLETALAQEKIVALGERGTRYPPVTTKTDFLEICWGDAFTRNFLNYGLPTLLSPGNLPAWSFRETATFILYAPAQDWHTMQQHPTVHRLAEIMTVEWRPIDRPKMGDDKYHHMGQCVSDAFNRARERCAGLVLLAPDALFADGSFAHLANLIAEGRDLVMICGWHVNEDEILPVLERDPETHVLNLSKTQCVRYINEFMHNGMKARFWNAARFTPGCSHIYKRLQNGSIQANCYHLHPLYLRYPLKGVDFTLSSSGTFDSNYMQQHWEDRHNTEIVQDNSIIAFNWIPALSPETLSVEMNAKPYSEEQRRIVQKAFEAKHTRPIHRFFYEHPIILKDNDEFGGAAHVST